MSLKSKIKHILKRLLTFKAEKNKKKPQHNLIINEGKNNRVILIKSGNKTDIIKNPRGLSISIKGKNNTIILSENICFNTSTISINSNNSTISIGKDSYCKNLKIFLANGNGQSVHIGEAFICFGLNIQLSGSQSFHIGDHCLFSYGIRVWGSNRGDGGFNRYNTLDKKSGTLKKNPKDSIEIGDETWVGFGVAITKNAKVAGNAIIGGRAILTGKIEEKFVAVAGNPAIIIKRGVTWNIDPPINSKRKEELNLLSENIDDRYLGSLEKY
jgi:acetyltransferase-like isoleucine patch superfamily enzyme